MTTASTDPESPVAQEGAPTPTMYAVDPSLPRSLRKVLSLDDFERAAKSFLPPMVFGFVAGGAEDSVALDGNRAAYRDYRLVSRVLVDVSKRSQRTTLFGRTYASPFGIAPLGLAAVSAYRADIVFATGAAKANIPMLLSGSSLIRMEDVAAASPAAWFQAYMPGDVPRTQALVERAQRSGYEVMAVTLDTPVAGNRENNIRTGFTIPLRPTLNLAWQGISHPGWSVGTFARTLLKHGMPHFENNYATRGVPILSRNALRQYSERGNLRWEHFDMIRRMWKGPLIVKGVLSRHDAKTAVERGADGVIVSNHGGRQLDSAVAPLRVLPGIVDACPGVPVMIDGGIRRGSDVLKALALGAKFAFLGRPFNFAAAIAGEAGVRHCASILATEIDRDMALLGVTELSQLRREHLFGMTAPDGTA